MEKNTNGIKNPLIGFGVIFLYLISSLLFIEIISLFGINFNSLKEPIKNIYNIACEILLVALIIYIYRKDFIPNLKEYIKNLKMYFRKYTKYWIIMLILMIGSNSIVTMFTTTNISENQNIILETLKKAPIYTFVITVFIAPILEELVFRLSFRKIFEKSNFLFILFSGLVFGSMHVLGTSSNLTDLLFIIPYSIPGFVFAYVYTNSKNICVPIGLHFLHNGVMMMLQILLLFIK